MKSAVRWIHGCRQWFLSRHGDLDARSIPPAWVESTKQYTNGRSTTSASCADGAWIYVWYDTSWCAQSPGVSCLYAWCLSSVARRLDQNTDMSHKAREQVEDRRRWDERMVTRVNYRWRARTDTMLTMSSIWDTVSWNIRDAAIAATRAEYMTTSWWLATDVKIQVPLSFAFAVDFSLKPILLSQGLDVSDREIIPKWSNC